MAENLTTEKDERARCASSHDGHPCGVCDGPAPANETDVPLATRLADPGDYVREQLIEGGFGDPLDMPLWQREHLARVIEHFCPPGRRSALGGP